MERKNESLVQSTNYLIQLFLRTDRKYSCSRSKIGKLLAIVAFKYAANDIIIFFDDIYKYPECGVAINGVSYRLDRDVYFPYLIEDDKRKISHHSLQNDVEIPNRFQNTSSLSPELKKDIEEVFFCFGAYSQTDLSEILNPIVESEGICRIDGSVDLSKIVLLGDKLPENKVVQYIFKS